MSLKFKLFRLVSSGIFFAKDKEEREELQVSNILLHLLCFFVSFFSLIDLYYGFYYHAITALIILIPAIISLYIVSKGYFLFSKLLCVQSIIIHVFAVNLYYIESLSLLYLYLIIIMNMPIVFRVKDLGYIIFFTLQSLLLFFIHVVFRDNLPKISTLTIQEIALHKNIATIILLIYLCLFLSLHVIIVQYRESKLKRYKINLIRIQKKLKSQNEDLQRFGLAVTHSLKTPLILSSGFLNRIQNNLRQNNSLELNNHYFKIVKESNSLIEKYSEDLSTYNSLINVRSQSLNFDINTVIKKQVKMMMTRFENAKIINHVDNVTINSNLFLFEIIVQILIENAIMYNDSEIATLRIENTIENNKIHIYFKDNGIGINEEFRDNIFLPFVRINKKINVGGSGLGLTSAKIACDKIGAKISLFESSHKGSTFKLELEQL